MPVLPNYLQQNPIRWRCPPSLTMEKNWQRRSPIFPNEASLRTGLNFVLPGFLIPPIRPLFRACPLQYACVLLAK